MSGFGFCVACRACGLASGGYPFVYDSILTDIVLPVANRATGRFERLVVPTDRELEAHELDQLAAWSTRPGFTVCVPRHDAHGVAVLGPDPECPSCGRTTVELRPVAARPPPPTARIEELVAASRAMTDDVTSSFRLDPPAVIVHVLHRAGPPRTFAWTVVHDRTERPARVLDALIAHLTALGSTCDRVRRFRGFTRFDERPAG